MSSKENKETKSKIKSDKAKSKKEKSTENNELNELSLKEDNNIIDNETKKKAKKSKTNKEVVEKTIEKENNEDVEETNESNSVFISGIPYTATEDEVTALFKDCGKIVEIKMPKYQDSGKNRGYAHITFKKTKYANKALELNKKVYINNRYLEVQQAKGENKYERKADLMDLPIDCKTVMIKNLDYSISESELAQMFKPCGDIRSIRMVYHSKLNHFKGFAFIDFENPESVKLALHLNGKELRGRKMIVDFEETAAKQGFKFRSKEPSKFNKEYNEVMSKSLRKKRHM